MRKLHPVNYAYTISVPDTGHHTDKIAEAIHRNNGGRIKRRDEKRAGQMSLVVFHVVELGAELAGGLIEGTEIICPRHGARFCLRTGQAMSPPAYEPIKAFETRIEADHVWVRCG